MTASMEKFQSLVRELFQIDCADLDFGIYRIMNHRRTAIDRFIAEDLPRKIDEELKRGALAEQSTAQEALAAARQKVLDALGEDAVDAAANLAEKYRATKAGKEYMEAHAKAAGTRSYESLEAAIYNHLFTFFSRYWQDGDFISKRRYSKKEHYAIPYNGEEVYLYWANHDQYYIKTGEYFTDYSYKAPNGVTIHFKLQQADVEQNNIKGEKRFFISRSESLVWDEDERQLTIPFEYRPLTSQESITYGQKNQQETINARGAEDIPKHLKKTAEALAALVAERRRDADDKPISYLEYHLRQYTSRNTSDFFIHKNLQGFLSRELDFYLKNEVLNLEEMESAGETAAQGWFQMMQIIKKVGNHIIDFLSQIEDFQKMLWGKRKFITETFYCITVGNIPEPFYPEIAACEPQWKEWKELLATTASKAANKRIELLKANPSLAIDTRHFPQDFTDRLLGSYDDIESMTDGLLVHSENWQALNILMGNYYQKLKCIYIDPPYNTDASAILYKNGYKASSWISLVDGRIRFSKPMLTEGGVLVAAIDDEQHRELSFTLSNNFSGRLLGVICVRANPSGRPTQTGFSVSHEYLLFAGQSANSSIGRMPPTPDQMSRFSEKDEFGQFEWRNLRREGSNSDRSARRALYYPIYIQGSAIRVPEMTWNEPTQEWIPQEEPKAREKILWPDTEEGVQKTWRWEWETVLARLSDLSVRKDRSGRDYIYYKRRPHEKGVVSVSSWFDAKYSATEHGTSLLKELFGRSTFSYPKSIHAVEDAICPRINKGKYLFASYEFW